MILEGSRGASEAPLGIFESSAGALERFSKSFESSAGALERSDVVSESSAGALETDAGSTLPSIERLLRAPRCCDIESLHGCSPSACEVRSGYFLAVSLRVHIEFMPFSICVIGA